MFAHNKCDLDIITHTFPKLFLQPLHKNTLLQQSPKLKLFHVFLQRTVMWQMYDSWLLHLIDAALKKALKVEIWTSSNTW